MLNVEFRGKNFCTSSGLLTATGAATTYDTTAAINYAIDGVLRVKATVAGGTTPVVDGISGLPITLTANKCRVVCWCLDLAGPGTVKVVAGEISDAGVPPQFPVIPNEYACFAYQVLNAGPTAGTITFGSSNWNATGFTNTIKNVAILPARPQST